MRTMLFTGALLCCSLPVFALDSNINLDSNNQCNVEFNGKMQLENNVLTIALDNDIYLSIDQNKKLYVDGTALILKSEQQRWVNNYYDGTNQAATQAAGIATEAVALASTALDEVFTELLGSDNTALTDLSDKLQNLDRRIQHHFYTDNGDIRLYSESFKNGKFFGQQWETQFEEAIEGLVADSIGHLMVSIGTQLIFSGDGMNGFEQKMVRFGEQIDQKIKYQALALEEKTDALCSTLSQIDFAETQLQQIAQLETLDIIQVQDQPKKM